MIFTVLLVLWPLFIAGDIVCYYCSNWIEREGYGWAYRLIPGGGYVALLRFGRSRTLTSYPPGR